MVFSCQTAPDVTRSAPLAAKSHKPEAVFSVPLTFRRHEAAHGRPDANDARTPAHDASPSTNDDASQAGHDATRQIRARRSLPIFVAVNREPLMGGRLQIFFTLMPFWFVVFFLIAEKNAPRMEFIAIDTLHWFSFPFNFFFFNYVLCRVGKYVHSFTITDFLKTLF